MKESLVNNSPFCLETLSSWWTELLPLFTSDSRPNKWKIYTLLWWQFLSSWLTHTIAIVSNYPDRRTTHMCIGHMYSQMHFWGKKLCKNHSQTQFLTEERYNKYKSKYVPTSIHFFLLELGKLIFWKNSRGNVI